MFDIRSGYRNKRRIINCAATAKRSSRGRSSWLAESWSSGTKVAQNRSGVCRRSGFIRCSIIQLCTMMWPFCRYVLAFGPETRSVSRRLRDSSVRSTCSAWSFQLSVPFEFTPELHNIPLAGNALVPNTFCQVSGWGYPAFVSSRWNPRQEFGSVGSALTLKCISG